MKIDFKAPTGFILDVSLLLDTIDAERVISPLTWQYVIEQDLINLAGLTLANSQELIPSLAKQISLVRFLQKELKFSIVNVIPGQLILHLRQYRVEVKMNGCALFIAINQNSS